MNGSYSKEELVAALGEPVGTETFGRVPGGTTGIALVFACTCRGMPNGNRYVIGSPCLAHGGSKDVIRISDRRCGPTALNNLSFLASGLLAELIRNQAGADRDDRGCTDLALEPDALREHGELVQELIEARLLIERQDGRLELVYFTCFDTETNEWY